MFWVYHILAICTVMGISYSIGYSVGKELNLKEYFNGNKIKKEKNT
jgi:hypothetical protein